MTQLAETETAHPPDICLMLRVHSEQRWLVASVIPIVRALEQPGQLDQDEVGPALSYLEVLSLEGSLRAIQTDAARERLDAAAGLAGHRLAEKARRYHVAVKRLRAALDRRVRRLTSPLEEELPQEATAP
ncbi:MAG: hypothetical protein ACYDC2_08110 [Solirubrobacteraceae bacterium]